jgi:hypothetical protein
LQLTAARLSWAAACVALLLAVGPRARAAGSEATSRLTFFREPSSSNAGVTVIHPQVDVTGALAPTFSLSAGYDVDIVSGATPQTFGPSSGVDAVSKATHFSDVRHEVKGGFEFGRPNASVGAGASYGWESDYKSLALSGATRSDLMDHNFTLALGYTHNFDRVCDNNNDGVVGQPLDLKPLGTSTHCFKSDQTDTVTRHLSIDTFEPSLTWTATPRFVVQGGSTIQILDGFQSNPYRSVLVGSEHREPQERVPQYRQRYAVFARGAYALPDSRASLVGMIRLYRDSWALQAATAEVNVNKYVGQSVLLTVRGRYHQQTAASFYRNAEDYRSLGPAGQYWTGDRELSRMSNLLTGGKIAFLRKPEQERSWFTEMELSFKFETLFYRVDPDAPNYDRKMALIGSGAFALRF